VAIRAFPPVDSADEYGLLAVGGDLDVSSLLLAYQSGIFPWPLTGEQRVTWFAPPERAVLFTAEFAPSHSLVRSMRRKKFTFSFDTCFEEVIGRCASLRNRPREKGTWITAAIQAAYTDLHRAGHAHSLEVFDGETLVGGLYGVSIGKFFAGESMFHEVSDASKAALCMLCKYLKEAGVEWIDCQVTNRHLATLGVREIPRDEYMEMLVRAVSQEPIEFSTKRLRALNE